MLTRVKRVVAQVFAAVVQLVEDDLLLEPYFDSVLPLVQDCALDPTSPRPRTPGARARHYKKHRPLALKVQNRKV